MLNKYSVEHTIIDITEDEEARQRVMEHGGSSLPVLQVDDTYHTRLTDILSIIRTFTQAA